MDAKSPTVLVRLFWLAEETTGGRAVLDLHMHTHRDEYMPPNSFSRYVRRDLFYHLDSKGAAQILAEPVVGCLYTSPASVSCPPPIRLPLPLRSTKMQSNVSRTMGQSETGPMRRSSGCRFAVSGILSRPHYLTALLLPYPAFPGAKKKLCLACGCGSPGLGTKSRCQISIGRGSPDFFPLSVHV